MLRHLGEVNFRALQTLRPDFQGLRIDIFLARVDLGQLHSRRVPSLLLVGCDLAGDRLIVFAGNLQSRAGRLPEKPLSCLIFRRWRDGKSIILVIDMQSIISNFNGSEAFDFTVPVYIFKLGKVKFFLFQYAIVAQLVARLLLVKLVLEDVNLAVELLKLVKEWSLVRGYDERLFALTII